MQSNLFLYPVSSQLLTSEKDTHFRHFQTVSNCQSPWLKEEATNVKYIRRTLGDHTL